MYRTTTSITASSIAQPLASPLSSERSPNRLSYSFPPSLLSLSPPSSRSSPVLTGILQDQPCHPICHPPMSEKSHGHDISPSGVVTGARWYPNCVSPRNNIHRGEICRVKEWTPIHRPSPSQPVTSPNQCPHFPRQAPCF